MDPVMRSLALTLLLLTFTFHKSAGNWVHDLNREATRKEGSHTREGSSVLLRGMGVGLKERGIMSRLLNDDASSAQAPTEPDADPSTAVFNILQFGAVGDGKSNATAALLQALVQATAVSSAKRPATVLIPANGTFRLWPLTIEAANYLTLQIDGDIIGPSFPALWSPTNALIQIKQQRGFKLLGKGHIDLDGAIWGDSITNERKPNGILITGCNGCLVKGISMYNSPATQILIRDSSYVVVEGVILSAPDYSKDAGGIMIQTCKRCTVKDTNVKSGDDHVLIGDGCDGVVVHNCLFQGRGKGVSVAGFGPDVHITRITVRNSVFKGTYFGARVLSRVNDRGSTSSILFRNLTMDKVDVPIVINQLYGTCQPEDNSGVQANLLEPEERECQSLNERTGIAVANVTFTQISATIPNTDRLNVAGVFRCSNIVPCEGILMRTVNISVMPGVPDPPRGLSFTCSRASGQSIAVSPPSCLK